MHPIKTGTIRNRYNLRQEVARLSDEELRAEYVNAMREDRLFDVVSQRIRNAVEQEMKRRFPLSK
jgi:hypothetical protein